MKFCLTIVHAEFRLMYWYWGWWGESGLQVWGCVTGARPAGWRGSFPARRRLTQPPLFFTPVTRFPAGPRCRIAEPRGRTAGRLTHSCTASGRNLHFSHCLYHPAIVVWCMYIFCTVNPPVKLSWKRKMTSVLAIRLYFQLTLYKKEKWVGLEEVKILKLICIKL